MLYCKKCVMPNTRPGIVFDDEGICSACRAEEKKLTIDWNARYKELENLCDTHRNCNGKYNYDCIIAVSGGKDSHFQVHTLKNEMNMNPLLVTVEDNYSKTLAGKNNLRNISEVFSCNIISYKPDLRIDRIISKECFKAYGRPAWLLDKLIYTFPLKIALSMNIPLVVYGENVSYTYGGNNAKDTPSALEQINNGSAADIPFDEIVAQTEGKVSLKDLGYLYYPKDEIDQKLYPIYLSYFVPWSSYKNYIFASSVGFQTLHDEWNRENCFCNYEQIDSVGYLANGIMKYVKFGHGFATDYASRFIRYGIMTRDEAVALVRQYDHKIDQRCVNDFCNHIQIHKKEFFEILDTLYNKDIFEKSKFGEWVLKNPVWKN